HELVATGQPVDADEDVRGLQGHHQVMTGQGDVPGVRSVPVDDGGNPSPAPRAAGSALAELGARLSGDADLRHGGDSFGAEDLAPTRDAGLAARGPGPGRRRRG